MIQSYLLGLLIVAGLISACTVPVSPPVATTDSVTPPETTRVVQHALGESTVPTNPQRIVALEWTYVEDLLALGIQPVGVADIEGFHAWVKIPVELGPDVVDVGERGEPNLETLAGLKPDLILAVHFRVEENYAQLNAIAPTVVFDPYPSDESLTQYAEMRQTLLTIADLVGRSDEGEAVLAHMEQKFADARSQLEAAGKVGESFVLAQAFGGDTVQIRLFTANAMATEIVTLLGLENGWQGPFDQYGFTTVSVETLPELGDVHFFYVVQDDNNVFTRAALQPLWESLPFVQSGKAYPLGGDTWLFGGPLSAELVVDKIMNALVPAAATGGTATTSDATHIVAHAMGETTVPATPQRVVVLDTGELDNALALGIKPIGAPVAEALQYQEYLADQLDGVSDIGTISEPSLEAILALKPDLILGSKQRYEAIYDQLAQIAPTVLSESLRVPWQDNFRLHAEALGKTAQAEQLLAAYAKHVTEVQAALGDQLNNVTISVIRFRPGQVRLYLKSSYIGYILQDVGLARPAAQEKDEFSSEITLEQIADVDADYIFITGYATNDSDMDAFLESAMWTTLDGVKAGHALAVNDDTWISGLGIQAANLVLDDLVNYLQQ